MVERGAASRGAGDIGGRCSSSIRTEFFPPTAPGDPQVCDYAIGKDKEIDRNRHFRLRHLLSHQIMALDFGGATSFKMEFGHHSEPSGERPDTGRVSITSQNHGFAVEATLPANRDRTHQPV
jgi:carbamoyl-phosphate synthase small subunit